MSEMRKIGIPLKYVKTHYNLKLKNERRDT